MKDDSKNKEKKYQAIDEVIDVLEYAKQNKTPPLGCKGYKIEIRGKLCTFFTHVITVKELLESIGCVPVHEFALNIKFVGEEMRKFSSDFEIDFTLKLIERCVVIPLDANEGL